ncbi:MAG TPA: hypothetical protein VHP30_02860 [Ignavibacteriales bacterium]|nr:hypothetical protein [Ignavibacteriales bacterium]
MAIPDLEFTPPHIKALLCGLKPYMLVMLTKGENYNAPGSWRIVQSERLPYLFEYREKGIVLLSMRSMDEGSIAAFDIYRSTDKNEVRAIVENDPAVKAKIYNYEILTSMGLAGDKLK